MSGISQQRTEVIQGFGLSTVVAEILEQRQRVAKRGGCGLLIASQALQVPKIGESASVAVPGPQIAEQAKSAVERCGCGLEITGQVLHATEVVQDLSLAELVAEIAIQDQSLGQRFVAGW